MQKPFSIGLLALLLFAAACGGRGSSPSAGLPPDTPVLFEGARIIVGDGRVIENGSVLVDGGSIRWVGAEGEIAPQAGAARVDLSGKTVMPAMIDAHAHLGYEGFTSWGGENYTRDNVIDHLQRYAYYGFAAVFGAGTDPVEMLLELERDQEAGTIGGARLVFAAGMAPPGQGPNARMLESAAQLGGLIVRDAGTVEAARASVREVASLEIPFIKIWVDDRNGAQEKMTRPVFEAIIEEASANDIAVVAHQQSVQDMKELLEAGIAGFLHGRLGPDFDDELISMMTERDVFIIPNIGLGERNQIRSFEDPFLSSTLRPEVVQRLSESYTPQAPNSEQREQEMREAFGLLLDNDVEIVLGTDAGAIPDHFFGYSGHRELEIYTRLGMTPMEAIIAATSRAAKHLGIADLGTITAGASADFIVLDANPLDDIRNTRRISDVYLRGERLDREGLRMGFTSSG